MSQTFSEIMDEVSKKMSVADLAVDQAKAKKFWGTPVYTPNGGGDYTDSDSFYAADDAPSMEEFVDLTEGYTPPPPPPASTSSSVPATASGPMYNLPQVKYLKPNAGLVWKKFPKKDKKKVAPTPVPFGGYASTNMAWAEMKQQGALAANPIVKAPGKGNTFYGYTVRTQKALGVVVLVNSKRQYAPGTDGLNVTSINHLLDVNKYDLSWISYPQFARPCPLTPRHGFVESRVVRSKGELEQVIKETRDADPEGEVMLMDYVSAMMNVVWTPSLLTIGMGHDGATGGKGVVTFPLNGIWDDHIKDIAKRADVKDYPYVEAVFREPGYGAYTPVPWLTQLRNGPIMDAKPDYIPTQVVVSEVISPDVKRGDLLEWEKLMLAINPDDGVVVWHPGGSQADHFAVHARSCGVACVTSKEPKVGDILEPVDRIAPNYESVLRGLVVGSTIPLEQVVPGVRSKFNDVATTMLMGLHNSSAMEGDQAWWFGASIALMLRLGSMALRGEARHLNPARGGREQVYRRAGLMKVQAHQKRCNALINIFRYGWSIGAKGIGGRAWAQCGLSLAGLFNAVGAFVQDPNDSSYGALTRSFNTTINQAHNGGWWMNKFVGKEVFDWTQTGSLTAALKAAPFMYRLESAYREIGEEKVDRVVEKWKRWEPISLRPSRVTGVEVDLPLQSSQLSLRIKDRLIGKLRPTLFLDVSKVLKKVPSGWDMEFGLVEGDEGVSVEVSFPGHVEEGMVIWREPTLTTQEVIGDHEDGDPDDNEDDYDDGDQDN